MDADEELLVLANRIKEAISELKSRGFQIAELHVGRDVARKLAVMTATKQTSNINVTTSDMLEKMIESNEGPFEIGYIGPGVPIICLDRGDDNWCEASYRQLHSK